MLLALIIPDVTILLDVILFNVASLNIISLPVTAKLPVALIIDCTNEVFAFNCTDADSALKLDVVVNVF
jgi:hypothetical protein